MNRILNEFEILINGFINQIILIMPKLTISLVIFIIGLILAKFCKNLIQKLFLFIDRYINNKLTSKNISIDLQSASKIISTILFWSIILLTTLSITQIFEFSYISKWVSGLMDYIPHIVAAFLIIVLGVIIGKFSEDLYVSVANKSYFGKPQLIGKWLKYVIIFTTIIIAIEQVGINISFLSNLILIIVSQCTLGAILTFALGAYEIVNNIISSHYILKDFKLGDKILVNDTIGEIVKITSTSVILNIENGKLVIPAKTFRAKELQILEKE